ncbi:MAG: threonine synthase [Clostridia bacterium]|nr:threonine synthase [Clostridia bacterium]
MKFISTRGAHKEGVSSAYAIKTGLASDGGLFMPESIPHINLDFIKEITPLSYPERAAKILGLFLTDYTAEELLTDTSAAYSSDRFVPSPAPITSLGGNTYMLELWHGPTSAFKDMALQIMPRLFTRALKKCGEEREALILVATSGDTGKAALEGYRDVPGTKIKVFYPIDGVSRVQKLQMQTQEGKNVSICGIKGNFDDAQTGVKQIFSDSEFASELSDGKVFLSSANSINWGRLVPQIVYYISAYCDLCASGAAKLGESINVCVPTGNFGNIFAGYIAKLMGTPINKLVCASNKNNILTDFLSSGVYDRNRAFHTTMSPSMDILISSNLERLLYTVSGCDRTRELMRELNEHGRYDVGADILAKINESFVGYYTDESECADTIKNTYEKKNRLIDTHTAVAVSAAERFMSDCKTAEPMLVVSTASPYKFAGDVLASLSGSKPEDDLEAPEMLHRLTGVDIPSPLARILGLTPIHKNVIDKEDMKASVRDFALSASK